jgi:DNA-binding MarR family transcriptional regulator
MGKEREEFVLAALHTDPTATALELAGRIGLTEASVDMARRRLLRQGRVRRVERAGHNRWRYEVIE